MAGSTDEEWNGDGGDSDEEDDDEDDEDYGSPKRKRKRRSSGKKKKTPTGSRTTTAASKSRTKGSAASKAKDSFTSVKAKVEELSEYELIRQKNIESRMKMFEELNISDSKQRLSDSFGSSGPSDRGSRNASRRGLVRTSSFLFVIVKNMHLCFCRLPRKTRRIPLRNLFASLCASRSRRPTPPYPSLRRSPPITRPRRFRTSTRDGRSRPWSWQTSSRSTTCWRRRRSSWRECQKLSTKRRNGTESPASARTSRPGWTSWK